MRTRNIITVIVIILAAFFIQLFLVYSQDSKKSGMYVIKKNSNKTNNVNISFPEIFSNDKKVTLSFIGDCTIGWDTNFSYSSRFDKYLKDNNNDYSYYFKNVKDIFKDDDMTIANLEGTFTDYTVKVEKKFNFKAPKEYAKVLTLGNVDTVSFTNNHAYDYGNIGFTDTIDTLNEYGINHFEYDNYLIKEVNGIKLGFFAMHDIYGRKYTESLKAINYLKSQNCDLIIASFHWGIEGEDKQSDFQVNLGHYLVDNGVDLVIGHHPHRIQGIEKYKGKYIVYSLGNFVFGGNRNPADKDTFIFQQTFTYNDNILLDDDNIKIIPARISSEKNINNYQPIILYEDSGKNVLNRILRNSKGFSYK